MRILNFKHSYQRFFSDKLVGCLSLVILFLTTSALFQACKKESTTVNSASNAREFTAIFGPQAQQKLINAGEPNTFTLQGGTKITIPAHAFTLNGVAVTGNVVVTAGEFLKRSAILFSGTNTNHISGAPLTSDGFIFLNAAVNNTNVDKKLAVPIQVALPTSNTRSTRIWEGVEQVGNFNQMAWQEPNQNQGAVGGIPIESSAINGFYNFQMGNLGWINCDVFYAYTHPKTTTRVTLINNPGSFAAMMGLSGSTFVFFCAKGSNVVAQLYTPDGSNTVRSYTDSMPIGVEGKYISFSIKDGKYYLAVQEITITANQNITLTLSETTEEGIQQVINALNTY